MDLKHALNVVVYPAPDLAGQWVAHCLELDMVSQANDAAEAIEMIAEAIELAAEANVDMGRPPLDFRSAPPDAWKRLEQADTSHSISRILRLKGPPSDEVTITPHFRRAS